jgi:hypothetical protein
MYNLGISIGLGLVFLLLGWLVGGAWYAGIIPSLIAIGVAYFLLMRRTGKQLEAIMMGAMAEMEALNTVAQPTTPGEYQKLVALRDTKLARVREIMRSGFALGKWQFLVNEQIYAQLGSLDYMEQKWAPARQNLEKAWSRNWQSQALLACIDHREKKADAALARMKQTEAAGGREPLFWALYTWMAVENGKTEVALQAVATGLTLNGQSKPLKDLAEAVRNKRPVKVTDFAPGWYQFFPEAMMTQQQKEQQQVVEKGRHQYRPPQPRR